MKRKAAIRVGSSRDMKKSNGMSAWPTNSFVNLRTVEGCMFSVSTMPPVPSTSAR